MKGTTFCKNRFLKIKGHDFFQGETVKTTLTKFKNLLQNHWANFNQIEDIRNITLLFLMLDLGLAPRVIYRPNEGPRPLPWGVKSKITFTIVENLPLQNHWVNFNQTWLKISFGEGGSNFYK